MDYVINNIQHEDLSKVIKVVHDEGWEGYSQEDLELIINISPQSCFKLECNGEFIGSIFSLRVDKVSYISFYIVKEQYRKTIYAIKLGLSCFNKELDEARLMVIYANQKKINMYQKKGFLVLSDFRRFQFQGFRNNQFTNVFPLERKDVDKIKGINNLCYKSDRNVVINHFILREGIKCFVYKERNNVEGYACIRRVNQLYIIGPMVAMHEKAAYNLLMRILNDMHQKPIILDAEENKFNKFLTKMSIPYVLSPIVVTKMYLGSTEYLENETYLYAISGHHYS